MSPHWRGDISHVQRNLAAMSLHSREDISHISESTASCLFVVGLPAAATSVEVHLVEEDKRVEQSDSASSVDASDTDDEVMSNDDDVVASVANEATVNLSNETRERLCLKAEQSQSVDIALHPVLVAEWMNWIRQGLYEGEEDDDKKRDNEENNLREEIMKKFPRKGVLKADAPTLNPEILAYISGTAKSRDKHFVSSQNAIGSAMVAVATGISFILELEENDISNTLLQILGNAGKLLAGLHYQHSVMRRAFILPGVDDKYRALLRKSAITDDLFGQDLFKRLKHTKSLDKVVGDLAPHPAAKKPLRNLNWGNRKSLLMKPRGQAQQAQKGGPQRSLRYKNGQRNLRWNKNVSTRTAWASQHKR